MRKTLLEFPSHGNRIWHRCPAVYEAWKNPIYDEERDRVEIIQIGRYVMWFDDVADNDGKEDLPRLCLVPMYKIGGEFARGDQALDAWGPGTLTSYVCPACRGIFSLEEVRSGRAIDFGTKTPKAKAPWVAAKKARKPRDRP